MIRPDGFLPADLLLLLVNLLSAFSFPPVDSLVSSPCSKRPWHRKKVVPWVYPSVNVINHIYDDWSLRAWNIPYSWCYPWVGSRLAWLSGPSAWTGFFLFLLINYLYRCCNSVRKLGTLHHVRVCGHYSIRSKVLRLGINQTRANFDRIQHSQTDSAILSF